MSKSDRIVMAIARGLATGITIVIAYHLGQRDAVRHQHPQITVTFEMSATSDFTNSTTYTTNIPTKFIEGVSYIRLVFIPTMATCSVTNAAYYWYSNEPAKKKP